MATKLLSVEDNTRLYEMEQDILRIGDSLVSLTDTQVKSGRAGITFRRGLKALQAANEALNYAYEIEVKEALAGLSKA